jgi:hypothetical protein
MATLADLRDAPVVLIGAFDNEWAMRPMSQLRFRFEGGNDVFGIRWIADRQNPARRDWAVNSALPYTEVSEDYAIITRVLDPTTGRMVVIAEGPGNARSELALNFVLDGFNDKRFHGRSPRCRQFLALPIKGVRKINGSLHSALLSPVSNRQRCGLAPIHVT